MTWWCEAARRRPRAAGFTLIELLVVLAILGLVAGLFLGRPPPRGHALDLKAAASELAAELRLARARAIAGNRPVALELDLRAHRYALPGDRPRALPADAAIELLTIAGERIDRTRAGIRFNPDGSSTGGRISLADAHRRIAVGVDWLTGRVTIADVR